ncbi:MAG TPA: aspartate aminotransferase family protein [Thermomicrobiaceae bacterium]|nr:aspartate aminotransferase family protein [Thermomicrobiaceae bacterium]
MAGRTIEQDFVEQFQGSLKRYRRAVEAIPGGITHDVRHMEPFPLYVERAAGSRKWDVDGHEIIDYSMGHGALILGHSNAEIADAVAEQVHRGTHFGASHELEVEWAERVCRLVPSAERVEFTSSGTEATMLAMRIARAFTGRDRILKFAGHFHGWHDYAVAGERPPFEGKTLPGIPRAVLDTVVVAPVNDLDFVDRRLAEGDVAGVILEPSGASYSSIPVPEGFLARLREITERHKTVLIFDEVITGFRWAPGGKQEREGVTPDLTTMAKILAGGLPGGAVAGRADIMQLLAFRDEPGWNQTKKIGHPGTYNANPLSAVAGAVALQMVADPRVQRRADEMAARVRKGFNEVLVRQGVPGFAWGESSVFHLVLGQTCANQHGEDIHIPEGVDPTVLKNGVGGKMALALAQGMLLNGADLFHGGGLLSSVHTTEDIDRTVQAFDTTIARMRDEGFFGGA